METFKVNLITLLINFGKIDSNTNSGGGYTFNNK